MTVKLIFVARRRPELSAAQFQDYWVNQHAPLVRRLAETCRIRRYVQCPTVDTPANAGFSEARGMPVESPPDGVAEVWWESLEDLAAGFSGPAGEEAARRRPAPARGRELRGRAHRENRGGRPSRNARVPSWNSAVP